MQLKNIGYKAVHKNMEILQRFLKEFSLSWTVLATELELPQQKQNISLEKGSKILSRDSNQGYLIPKFLMHQNHFKGVLLRFWLRKCYLEKIEPTLNCTLPKE